MALTRTKSAKFVNGMLREAFADPSFDVSKVVRSGKNFALTDETSIVLFTRMRDKTTYSAILGVLPLARRKGTGTSTLNEGIAWMFANTKAQVIRGIIDPKVIPINKITSRIRVHNLDRDAIGGNLIVETTRESFLAQFPPEAANV